MASSSLISPALQVSQHRVQLIELQLLQVEITQEIGGKGAQLLGRFDQPLQHRVGINLEDPSGGADTQPSARQAKTRTMSSTAACLPWKSVPCVSKK